MVKILIATGGTGGHIYPALAAAEELRRRGHEVAFIGVLGSAAATLQQRGFRLTAIRARGFVAKSLTQKFLSVLDMFVAVLACVREVLSYRPDVVVGFGGYSSFPAVLAARLMARRAMFHEQNVVPGEANRMLTSMVQRICVGFKGSLRYFPEGKAVWTGTPFRVAGNAIDRATAARKFGLDPEKKIILVFGGSQGARRINGCILEVLHNYEWARDWQVIHATGELALVEVLAGYSNLPNARYVRPFIENIDEAYAACDLAVTRAGAGTVTELGMLGVPAVIIPYLGAKNHQLANARILECAGSAAIIEEKSLSSDILGAKILKVSENKSSRRDFQETLKGEFRTDAALCLADEVEAIAGCKPGK
ncbi:MAG: undecaprenyldiphospho-muramoylpentapeptide beta-N-acetylglucosaminyltransferase [Candidatus Omnitrophica bacterium]|nr:undecaprenyldiphospho-muramoylpentapeptide beta-N-acetylglucosaminyltransferase [Candidatus Omnitrophota bacterium]